MISRFLMILVAAVVAVFLLKAFVAVAILAAIAFGALFSINVARRALFGKARRRPLREPQPMRRVTPLARPTISVRR